MAASTYSESINIEREKANLLCLIKLTLNALIDQSSLPTAVPVFDDRNGDVTNFILTLERLLSFRMRATWLSERRFFWDFIRPACIGSCRQSIIERVEEISNTRSLKEKGRIWIKLALMEKKLSELLKLVISDCYLVRKFYHEDSIILSSQAYILSDQLAGLNALDFSFCFKHDGPIIAPMLLNDAEIDVIDLTPFLCYKSKHFKPISTDENSNEENQQPSPTFTEANELKPVNSTAYETVSLEKYKLEVEQRKYFEELLRHRDRELQQLKARHETLKGERESEIVQMENIILELQLELRTARDEAELKRKKVQPSTTSSSPKSQSDSDEQKENSPSTPTNDRLKNFEASVALGSERQLNDFISIPSDSSRRSSHSTTTTNTDDDQYELVRQLTPNTTQTSNQTTVDTKQISSPEMLSSATSLSTASISSDEEDEDQLQTMVTTGSDDENLFMDKSIGNQSGDRTTEQG